MASKLLGSTDAGRRVFADENGGETEGPDRGKTSCPLRRFGLSLIPGVVLRHYRYKSVFLTGFGRAE